MSVHVTSCSTPSCPWCRARWAGDWSSDCPPACLRRCCHLWSASGTLFCRSLQLLMFVNILILAYIPFQIPPKGFKVHNRNCLYHTFQCEKFLSNLSLKCSPVRMLWNAVSTLVESRAEVSMKLREFFSAKALASSVGTALRCLRSDLLPTWDNEKEGYNAS